MGQLREGGRREILVSRQTQVWAADELGLVVLTVSSQIEFMAPSHRSYLIHGEWMIRLMLNHINI